MTEEKIDVFAGTASNVVQSIRAFHIPDLQVEAVKSGQHFLYAYCLDAETRLQVISTISRSFGFPKSARNLDALADCLTDEMDHAGPQTGFVIVLEQLPSNDKFDKEARETLLDVFRDAAEFWAEKKVPFRVFYSFE